MRKRTIGSLAAVVTVAVALAVIYYAPARALALAAAGRSPHCPLENAWNAASHWRLLKEANDRIIRGSRLIETDPAGFRLWETPAGRFWIPEGSDYVLPFNLAEQERKIYGTGSQAVQAGEVVLDCGANVGAFTRVALKAGASLVVAIEPAPENIVCLKRNFAAEIAAGRVVVYEKGVWDRDDLLALNVDPHNSAADSFLIRREGGHAAGRVPVTTIDRLVEELQLERVDSIKMDIEGAEQRALEGGRATLARFRPKLALACYHNPTDPERIPALVQKAWSGYRMECGPCTEAEGRIRPDVLYFR